MTRVLWLLGSPGTGTAAAAQAVAGLFDIAVIHIDALTPGASPLADRVTPTATEARQRPVDADNEYDTLLAASAERVRILLDQLRHRPTGILTIAESEYLPPDLIAPQLATSGHALVVLPDPALLHRRSADPPNANASAPARLTAMLEAQAGYHELPRVHVDGPDHPGQLSRLVTGHWHDELTAGPYAAEGRELQALRAAENTARRTAALTRETTAGRDTPPYRPPVLLACECGRSGCLSVVAAHPDDESHVTAPGCVPTTDRTGPPLREMARDWITTLGQQAHPSHRESEPGHEAVDEPDAAGGQQRNEDAAKAPHIP